MSEEDPAVEEAMRQAGGEVGDAVDERGVEAVAAEAVHHFFVVDGAALPPERTPPMASPPAPPPYMEDQLPWPPADLSHETTRRRFESSTPCNILKIPNNKNH